MYELYYSQGACSMAIHVALLELNVPFKLHDVSGDKKKAPEYLALNARGTVPMLLDNGHYIREGVAILLHLFEKHKTSLLPEKGIERTVALEWLTFCNATLHPAMSRVFPLLATTLDANVKETALALAMDNAAAKWQDVETRLSESKYLAGEKLTVADILMTVIANWTANINSKLPAVTQKFALGPNTKRLLKEVSSLPSYQKALEAEQLEYKAAA